MSGDTLLGRVVDQLARRLRPGLPPDFEVDVHGSQFAKSRWLPLQAEDG